MRSDLVKKGIQQAPLDCMTVTGKKVGENIKGIVNNNSEVIRTADHPYSTQGGLAVLKGNIAPDGGVLLSNPLFVKK